MTTKYLGDGVWVRRTNIDSSDIMLPVEVQSSYSDTIQLLNAVSVAASGTSYSSWIDVDGYTAIGFTLTNDAATDSSLTVQWSNDGTNLHGEETLATGTSRYKPVHTKKVTRYMRIKVTNGHTAAHTMSAWANLQV